MVVLRSAELLTRRLHTLTLLIQIKTFLTSSNLHATPPTIVDLLDIFNNVIACNRGVFLYHLLHESEILFGDTFAS